MAKSVYRVWLDDDKMRRGRPAYQRAKDRNQLIIYGIFALYLVISLVSVLATLVYIKGFFSFWS